MDLPQIVKCVNPDCQAPIQAGAIHCPRCGASQLRARPAGDDGTGPTAGARPLAGQAAAGSAHPVEASLCWDRIDSQAVGPMRAQGIYRTPVPGGWLVACVASAAGGQPTPPVGGSLAFLPDPDHRWLVRSLEAA